MHRTEKQPIIQFAPVEKLLLDPENPRLPEELQGSEQDELFQYFLNHGVLDELMGSMADNGFFEHEPLITLPPNNRGDRVVVEGNRRLAALMALHSLPSAAATIPLGDISKKRLQELAEVPVYEVKNRKQVRASLGFRHISGLKPWPPEAKARYLYERVEEARGAGDENPFAEVARRVGSNSLGVRNSYLAFLLLRFGSEECGANVRYVLSERFGVWSRCMTSPDIRAYMNLGDPKSYDEVAENVRKLNCSRLTEIIADLTPRDGNRPILQDSRDVTDYGRVLVDKRAHATLRRVGDLAIAAQLIKQTSFAIRLDRLRKQIETFNSEIASMQDKPTEELGTAAEALFVATRVLRGTVKSLAEHDDSIR